jgi:methyl-accepting chemotaxis protein
MTLHGASSRTFKGTLDAIHVALQQVTAIIDNMAGSTDDIAAENHDLFEQIAEQANGLKAANASIMQIAGRIRDSASHAETANGLARETSRACSRATRWWARWPAR